MGELQEVGEAKRRRAVGSPGGRGGERRQLAVGGGEEDDVARRLIEIDGAAAVIDRADVAREEVHLVSILGGGQVARELRARPPLTRPAVRLCRPGRDRAIR